MEPKTMPLDPKLLELLRCPACEDRPELREEGDELICTVCARRYPVENGIPRLVVDDLGPQSLDM